MGDMTCETERLFSCIIFACIYVNVLLPELCSANTQEIDQNH